MKQLLCNTVPLMSQEGEHSAVHTTTLCPGMSNFQMLMDSRKLSCDCIIRNILFNAGFALKF